MSMFAENIEHIDMIRTPLKARNQEYTPALGKRQANRTMFATPTKRLVSATPRSVLGKKTNCRSPDNKLFKKPRMSPSMKLPVKTPGKFDKYKQVSTPGKFSIYEDAEDEILAEMKRNNFKIEEPEKCPWADKSTGTSRSEPPPSLEIVDDFICHEPTRKRMRPIKLDPLPVGKDQEEYIFNFDTDYTLPALPQLLSEPQIPLTEEYDEPELCPWADISSMSDRLDTTPEELQLEISTCSEIDITKDKLRRISIRCFNESYALLESELSDDELPDIPNTPELDQELAELLELSFDTFNW